MQIVGIFLVLGASLYSVWSKAQIEKDLQQFQGLWKAVWIQQLDGTQAPMNEIQHARLFVEGNRFTIATKSLRLEGTLTIDPSKSPKTIDVVLDEQAPDEKLLGIYEITGDYRRSCFSAPGDGRPTAFHTSVPGYVIFEWTRVRE